MSPNDSKSRSWFAVPMVVVVVALTLALYFAGDRAPEAVADNGEVLAKVPEKNKNPFGRPIFQGLQYSDTPIQPLVEMRYTDTTAKAGKKHQYRVVAVNTEGHKSK